MIGLCMRHVPMELRTDVRQVDFWFVPMDVDMSDMGQSAAQGGEAVSRCAHNTEIARSTRAPATIRTTGGEA